MARALTASGSCCAMNRPESSPISDWRTRSRHFSRVDRLHKNVLITVTHSTQLASRVPFASVSVSATEANREFRRQLSAVRDGDQNVLVQPVQLEEECRDRVRRSLIEIAGRFIAQQEPRMADERAGNRDTLLFAARQFRGTMIDAIETGRLLRSAFVPAARDHRQRVVLRRLRPSTADQRRDEHVLEHRTLRQQAVILKDEPDFGVAEAGQGCRRQARTDPVQRA